MQKLSDNTLQTTHLRRQQSCKAQERRLQWKRCAKDGFSKEQSMNIVELKERLKNEKVNTELYCFDVEFPNEALCLIKNHEKWEVYYSEKGIKTGIVIFNNEESACEYFYFEIVTNSLNMGISISSKWNEIIEKLKKVGVMFEKGLSFKEIENIETKYKVKFPPDLKEFYLFGLPISKGFINWRNESNENVEKIKECLEWPLEGMLFDIENNSFWYKDWGKKPESISDAKEKCKKELKNVPNLIPIYSHRYIPTKPYEENNPIFSVLQTDIIYYGKNLIDYFENEFKLKQDKIKYLSEYKRIEFWSDIIE